MHKENAVVVSKDIQDSSDSTYL